jgi:small GTP-binding protein
LFARSVYSLCIPREFAINPRRRIELQLWDTAGQELFRSITRGYYRGAQVAYAVFDLTNHSSFSSVDHWITDVKEVADLDVIIVLIGNKSDLTDARQVTAQEAEDYAASRRILYFETSAKTGEGISEAIQSCIGIIGERADSGQYASTSPSASLIMTPEPEKTSCC